MANIIDQEQLKNKVNQIISELNTLCYNAACDGILIDVYVKRDIKLMESLGPTNHILYSVRISKPV